MTMRKFLYPLVALCFYANLADCLAQSPQDMANAKNWHDSFIQYYDNNKKNFEMTLTHIKQQKSKLSYQEQNLYNQNVAVLKEQYDSNVIPFEKLLKDKQINSETVKLTKDADQKKLLTWFGEMDTKSKTLYGLTLQINALNK